MPRFYSFTYRNVEIKLRIKQDYCPEQGCLSLLVCTKKPSLTCTDIGYRGWY